MHDSTKKAWKSFTEEIEVAGHQLVDEINRLVAEGNVRKLQVRSKEGEVVLNVPLTAGALAGGVVVLAAPWIAIIAAIAGTFANLKIEVVRYAKPETVHQAPADASGVPLAGD